METLEAWPSNGLDLLLITVAAQYDLSDSKKKQTLIIGFIQPL